MGSQEAMYHPSVTQREKLLDFWRAIDLDSRPRVVRNVASHRERAVFVNAPGARGGSP